MSSSPSTAPRPTGADVARRAGVSRATVSYILNGTPGPKFTPETREAVLRAADELGYRPNLAARTLAAGTGMLLLVVPRLPQSQFNIEMTERLTRRLTAHGLLTTVVFETDDGGSLIDALDTLRPRAVLHFAPLPAAAAERAHADGIPLLGPAIAAEAARLGAVQVDHLVGRGHRRIAYATIASGNVSDAAARGAEITAAATAAGLKEPDVRAFRLDGADATGLVRDLAGRGVTGVAAYNDDVALAVLFGIREAGLTCPADLAVIGVDAIPAGAVAFPPLTTVAIDAEPAADYYVRGLLHQLGVERHRPEPAPSALTVLVRAST